MKLEDLDKWEQMPLATLMAVLTKWFGCDEFEFTCNYRKDVESSAWYTVKYKLPSGKQDFVSASRLDLVKERLIKTLDRNKVSGKRLNQA